MIEFILSNREEFSFERAVMYFSLITVGFIMLKNLWLEFWTIPYKIEKRLCMKCVTFWITLLISMNPITATLATILAMVFESNINVTRL